MDLLFLEKVIESFVYDDFLEFVIYELWIGGKFRFFFLELRVGLQLLSCRAVIRLIFICAYFQYDSTQ